MGNRRRIGGRLFGRKSKRSPIDEDNEVTIAQQEGPKLNFNFDQQQTQQPKQQPKQQQGLTKVRKPSAPIYPIHTPTQSPTTQTKQAPLPPPKPKQPPPLPPKKHKTKTNLSSTSSSNIDDKQSKISQIQSSGSSLQQETYVKPVPRKNRRAKVPKRKRNNLQPPTQKEKENNVDPEREPTMSLLKPSFKRKAEKNDKRKTWKNRRKNKRDTDKEIANLLTPSSKKLPQQRPSSKKRSSPSEKQPVPVPKMSSNSKQDEEGKPEVYKNRRKGRKPKVAKRNMVKKSTTEPTDKSGKSIASTEKDIEARIKQKMGEKDLSQVSRSGFKTKKTEVEPPKVVSTEETGKVYKNRRKQKSKNKFTITEAEEPKKEVEKVKSKATKVEESVPPPKAKSSNSSTEKDLDDLVVEEPKRKTGIFNRRKTKGKSLRRTKSKKEKSKSVNYKVKKTVDEKREEIKQSIVKKTKVETAPEAEGSTEVKTEPVEKEPKRKTYVNRRKKKSKVTEKKEMKVIQKKEVSEKKEAEQESVGVSYKVKRTTEKKEIARRDTKKENVELEKVVEEPKPVVKEEMKTEEVKEDTKPVEKEDDQVDYKVKATTKFKSTEIEKSPKRKTGFFDFSITGGRDLLKSIGYAVKRTIAPETTSAEVNVQEVSSSDQIVVAPISAEVEKANTEVEAVVQKSPELKEKVEVVETSEKTQEKVVPKVKPVRATRKPKKTKAQRKKEKELKAKQNLEAKQDKIEAEKKAKKPTGLAIVEEKEPEIKKSPPKVVRKVPETEIPKANVKKAPVETVKQSWETEITQSSTSQATEREIPPLPTDSSADEGIARQRTPNLASAKKAVSQRSKPSVQALGNKSTETADSILTPTEEMKKQFQKPASKFRDSFWLKTKKNKEQKKNVRASLALLRGVTPLSRRMKQPQTQNKPLDSHPREQLKQHFQKSKFRSSFWMRKPKSAKSPKKQKKVAKFGEQMKAFAGLLEDTLNNKGKESKKELADVGQLEVDQNLFGEVEVDETGKKDYSKYTKMHKFGLPEGPIRQAMLRDKCDPKEIDFFFENIEKNPDALNPTQPKPTEEVSEGKEATLKLIEKAGETDYSKYVKMAKVKMPEGAILVSMERDGLSQENIDFFMANIEHPHLIKSPDERNPKLLYPEKRGEVDYEKYKKMFKMKVPETPIRMTMQGDGLTEDNIYFFFQNAEQDRLHLLKPLGEEEDEQQTPKKPPTNPFKPAFLAEIEGKKTGILKSPKPRKVIKKSPTLQSTNNNPGILGELSLTLKRRKKTGTLRKTNLESMGYSEGNLDKDEE